MALGAPGQKLLFYSKKLGVGEDLRGGREDGMQPLCSLYLSDLKNDLCILTRWWRRTDCLVRCRRAGRTTLALLCSRLGKEGDGRSL